MPVIIPGLRAADPRIWELGTGEIWGWELGIGKIWGWELGTGSQKMA